MHDALFEPPTDRGGSTAARPEQIGPYRIVRRLGGGSMGIVDLAEHTETQEKVALKRIAAQRADSLAAIRREIHALRSLSHPGVVRIVADGVAAFGPWYAMEFLDGVDLPAHAASMRHPATDRAVGRTAALALARRLAEALDHVHAAGIVHGDLKPQNVLVCRGDAPVLVDFGLAWRYRSDTSRAALDDVSALAGTPHYMAPERIAGEPIDARADLYSLGCILYELLAGRPPFAADDGQHVLLAHLTKPADPPSIWAPTLPAALDELVLGLLHKSPRERLGHAADVIAILADFGATATTTATPPYAARLYVPRVSGRDSVLGTIADAAASAQAGRGGAFVISGESGIGKTHLLAEAARRCGNRLQVVTASCSRGAGARMAATAVPLDPFRPLLRAIADHCVEHGEAATARILGDGIRDLARYEPALDSVPTRVPPPNRREGLDSAAREHLFALMREAFASFVRERPTVLFIDDAQWADELSLAFLRTLPRGWCDTLNLLIVIAFRTEDAAADVSSLPDALGAESIVLGGLDAAHVGDVVADMLSVPETPESVLRFLARQSAGNPFYIAEYLREAIASGLLVRAAGSRPGIREGADLGDDALRALPLPGTLEALVARRLEALSPAALTLAETAAVLGGVFRIEVLQLTSGLAEEDAFAGLTELLRRQAMESLDSGRARFIHGRLSEIAYERIQPDRRRALHARAADSLEESVDGAPPQGHRALLAHHWRHAADFDRELGCRVDAASEAFDASAFVEAGHHWQRALDLADDGRLLDGNGVDRAVTASWESWLARCEFALGNLDRATEHAGKTIERLGHRLPTTRRGWAWLCLREAGVQLGQLLGVAARRTPVSASQRRALVDAARAGALLTHRYYYIDDTAAFLGSALFAVNRAGRARAEHEVPRAYLPLALVARMLRLNRLYQRYFALAQLGSEALLDRNERAYTLTAEAVAHATFGRFHEASEPAQRAFDLIRTDETSFMRELVVVMMGHLCFYGGRIRAALGWYEEVERLARGREHPQAIPWGLFSRARCLHALGMYAEALPLIEEARAMLAARPELQSETYVYGLLASTLQHLGRDAEAVARADEALERMRRAGTVGFTADEGYALALRVYLRRLEAGDRSVFQRTRALLRLSRQFMRMVPASQPHLLLRLGEFEEWRGRPRAAQVAYRRSLACAEEFGMPRHVMLAHLALSVCATDAAARAEHRARAEQACPADLAPLPAGASSRDR